MEAKLPPPTKETQSNHTPPTLATNMLTTVLVHYFFSKNMLPKWALREKLRLYIMVVEPPFSLNYIYIFSFYYRHFIWFQREQNWHLSYTEKFTIKVFSCPLDIQILPNLHNNRIVILSHKKQNVKDTVTAHLQGQSNDHQTSDKR